MVGASMIRKMTVFLFLILIPTAVFCLDYTLDYICGTIEVQADDRWQSAAMGTTVAADSSLRLGSGSVAELSSGSTRITLSEAGTYFVSELTNSSRQVTSWGIVQMVRGKIRNLFRGRPDLESTAMGVRAKEVEEALELFDPFLQPFPDHANSQSVYFLSAFCNSQIGRKAEAKAMLRKAHAQDPTSETGRRAESMLGSL
jgi:tetratricopeptide (TPR) repeat protein